MPFLGIFRSKEKKLNDALVDLYGRVGMASLRSNASLKIALREKWNMGAMDASVEYAVRREFYCFYAHILDYFSFSVLGDRGRVLVTDSLVPLGIVPLVHRSLPGAGDEVREPVIADFLEYFNTVQFDYALSRVVFVSDMEEILRNDGVPVNDAFSDQPEAKVSRLIQKLNSILENNLPELEMKSEMAIEGADAFGASPKAMSFVILCAVIQNIVYPELAKAKLAEAIRKLRPLIR